MEWFQILLTIGLAVIVPLILRFLTQLVFASAIGSVIGGLKGHDGDR